MVVANMRKAETMMDHATMSRFRMPTDDLDVEVREYFQLRRKGELERIKCQIEPDRRRAEREKANHERLMRKRSAEVQRGEQLCTQRAPSSAPNFKTLDTTTKIRASAPTLARSAPLPSPPTIAADTCLFTGH